MKHTPGPWKVGKSSDSIITEGEQCNDPNLIEWYGGNVVAETVSQKDRNLICTAPELLKSLKDLIMWYDDGVSTHQPDCPAELAAIWKSAREAVDKAKGWDE